MRKGNFPRREKWATVLAQPRFGPGEVTTAGWAHKCNGFSPCKQAVLLRVNLWYSVTHGATLKSPSPFPPGATPDAQFYAHSCLAFAFSDVTSYMRGSAILRVRLKALCSVNAKVKSSDTYTGQGGVPGVPLPTQSAGTGVLAEPSVKLLYPTFIHHRESAWGPLQHPLEQGSPTLAT